MISPLLRSAGLALLVGLTAFGGPVTEAASIGVNLSIRSPAQVLPPSIYSGDGRNFTRDYDADTPPPVAHGGSRSRIHEFDPNTQYNGMTDGTANGKPLK
jgi:hypothetical protein